MEWVQTTNRSKRQLEYTVFPSELGTMQANRQTKVQRFLKTFKEILEKCTINRNG